MKYCYHTPKGVTFNNIANHNNTNHSSVKPQTVMVNNITKAIVYRYLNTLYFVLVI
jgi:hypothetical protein